MSKEVVDKALEKTESRLKILGFRCVKREEYWDGALSAGELYCHDSEGKRVVEVYMPYGEDLLNVQLRYSKGENIVYSTEREEINDALNEGIPYEILGKVRVHTFGRLPVETEVELVLEDRNSTILRESAPLIVDKLVRRTLLRR